MSNNIVTLYGANGSKLQPNPEKLPAIFSPRVDERVSDRYQFVDTATVIETLEGQGFTLRQASQKGKGPSGRHIARMTSDIDLGRGNKLEVILRNAHNGTSTLQLMMGVYRLVCSNGLVVGDDMIQPLYLRHTGVELIKQVQDALMQIDEQRRLVAEQVDLMQNTTLTGEQVVEFGRQALILAFPVKTDRHDAFSANAVLKGRRVEDNDETTWTAYNRVQENLLRGGLMLTGSRRQSRAVRNIDRDVSLNQKLWNLSVETARKAA